MVHSKKTVGKLRLTTRGPGTELVKIRIEKLKADGR